MRFCHSLLLWRLSNQLKGALQLPNCCFHVKWETAVSRCRPPKSRYLARRLTRESSPDMRHALQHISRTHTDRMIWIANGNALNSSIHVHCKTESHKRGLQCKATPHHGSAEYSTHKPHDLNRRQLPSSICLSFPSLFLPLQASKRSPQRQVETLTSLLDSMCMHTRARAHTHTHKHHCAVKRQPFDSSIMSPTLANYLF